MKAILLIVISILIPTCLLIALKLNSKLPNESNNGFSRIWINPYKLTYFSKKELTLTQPRICNQTDSSLYLTDNDPRIIFNMLKNFTKTDTTFIDISIPADKLTPHNISISKDKLYLHLNNYNSVLFGNFPNKPLKVKELPGQIFTKSTQLSDSIIVIRSLNSEFTGQSFKKININSGELIKEISLFENQTDMGISTDGILLSDSANIFYIEYFRNKIYCLDNNLNLIYQQNTIDTNSTSIVNQHTIIGQTKEKAKIEPSAARIAVNKHGVLSEKYIIVASGLRADNEKISDFNKGSTLDIYSKKDGKYQGSISIPKFKEKPVTSMLLCNDTLFATYSKYIVAYRFPIH